ncbi:MAG TPA: prepilin-type N-terminal cleavage/methylation domain-containing protein [Verrucomicrobiae bacterium]|jgi:prepilin-type N-terminal cleavage/methylation domain-containing protein/prepilin-type processing-associated H-X9-DG protein|nr:prepilin-type N-terminal cleavage/methylation domain-containing protein [Verrucomicrobiae bacterium]
MNRRTFCREIPLNTGCRAFTLIELLVVIAIIAILAAIMLPVLSQAQRRAQMIYDLNNFKQLQLCWHMYVQDNSDLLPLNFVGGGSAFAHSWVVGDAQSDQNETNVQNGVLFQYNQQVKIYQCPANKVTIKVNAGFGKILTLPQSRTCSINYSLGGNSAGSPNGPWTLARNGTTWNSCQKYSKIRTTRISQTIVFADEAQWTLDDGAFAMYPLESPMINIWFNLPCNRHSNGTVWSFADGHCEYWKWHGTTVNNVTYQTSYYNGNGSDINGDGSDDLPREMACSVPYP